MNIKDGTQFKIFCSESDLNGELLVNIETNKWIKYNDNTDVFYATKEGLTKKIKNQIDIIKPDSLFIIGIFSWHYNIVPLIFAKTKRKILSVRGMLHPGALTQKKRKKRVFLQLLRCLKIQEKICFHATDMEEEKFIKNEFGKNVNIVVASNFGKEIIPSLPLFKEIGSLRLVTIALISPMKNHLLVLKALEQCTANIQYDIYGAIKDEEYWAKCLHQIKHLPQNISVSYHGELLPSLLEDTLSLYHVFIMPSKSENFGHSIAEALSAAKPVITSHYTPWNNLQQNKAGLNVETTEVQILEGISALANLDNDEYKVLVEGSKNYSLQKANTLQNLKAYQKLFLAN